MLSQRAQSQLLLAVGCDRHETDANYPGWVTEWSIVHAWKACVPQGTEGSNPSPSAIKSRNTFSPLSPRDNIDCAGFEPSIP
jgi:hypothetical protein